MEDNNVESVLFQLTRKVHQQTRRNSHFADKLSPIQQELRLRRQQFLGSYVPVRELVLSSTGVDENTVDVLSHYLASRAICYWNFKNDEAEHFCYRFYRLSVYALASGKVSRECIDDILQLADCLIRSRKVFIIAMKDMLPQDMVGELFDFIDTANEHFLTPTFLDASLAGICVFLGVLADPIIDDEMDAEGN